MSDKEKQDGAAGQSWVERLSPAARKKIWLALTLFFGAAIFFVWTGSFLKLISSAAVPADPTMEALKTDLAGMLEEAEANLQDMADQINAQLPTDTPTTTMLTEANIAEIKEKLLSRQSADWPTYEDAAAGFSLKYLDSFQLATSTADDPALIVEFRQGPDQSFAVKQYRLIEEFFSEPNLRKYFSADGRYLAVFDTIHSTTTDLMLNSFKIIK